MTDGCHRQDLPVLSDRCQRSDVDRSSNKGSFADADVRRYCSRNAIERTKTTAGGRNFLGQLAASGGVRNGNETWNVPKPLPPRLEGYDRRSVDRRFPVSDEVVDVRHDLAKRVRTETVLDDVANRHGVTPSAIEYDGLARQSHTRKFRVQMQIPLNGVRVRYSIGLNRNELLQCASGRTRWVRAARFT